MKRFYKTFVVNEVFWDKLVKSIYVMRQETPRSIKKRMEKCRLI